MTDAIDERFMAAAIRLGASALGTTWPNPAVGAIVVKEGNVVGRGRTARGGRPHAEPQALAEAGSKARGATLYVSLEPCSHHGRTPPCADAVIAAGVHRVVAALPDADPRVAGNGFERLKAAGVAVVAPVLASAARRAHAGHFRRIASGRPHLALKLAISADGAIGRAGEGQVAITGELARRHVQAMRSRCDAILVGRGTVEADDPALTCRLPGLEARSPVRVVLDTEAKLDPDHRVFRDGAAPTWILTARKEGDIGGLRYFAVGRSKTGGIDLPAGLARLAREGITCVLVEGGARVARSLLESDLIDEIVLFRSPLPLGGIGERIVPALAGLPLSTLERSNRFRQVESRKFGPDRMTRFERAA